ncbi:ABC transporter type 1, transmembrane domain-containing protein [Kalaharituber pfeilii]|nr:ABC transporter type 1, transmembrane domain-containing protein [Kalaharituber pfeilii]
MRTQDDRLKTQPPNGSSVNIQLESTANIQETAECHPQQSNIEISSLNINPTTQNSFTKRFVRFPNAFTSIFRTHYFRLYRPLETWREKLLLISAIILSLVAGVPLPIIGVIFGKIINGFPPDEETLKIRIAQLIGVAIAYFLVTWGWATCWGIVGERVARGLREQMLKKAMGMDMTYFEVECVDIAHRLTADTQTIQLGVSEKCGLFLQSIAYFIAAFITGFVLNPRLTGILFVAVIPPMGCVIIFGTAIVSKCAQLAQNDSAKANDVAEGAINAVQVVQAFGVLERLAEEHLRLIRPAVKNGIKKSIYGAAMLGVVYFVAYAANALAFYEGSRIITLEGFDAIEGAGTVYTVVFLILDASFVIGQFGPFLQTFALSAAAGEKVLSIIDHPEPIISSYATAGAKLPINENGVELEFKDPGP